MVVSRGSQVELHWIIGADSLAYLSLEGTLRAAGFGENEGCTACWSQEYPVRLPRAEAEQLRLFEKTRR